MSQRTYGHVLVLPRQRLVRPTANYDCYMSRHMYGHALVLLSQRLLCPAADDDFVIS